MHPNKSKRLASTPLAVVRNRLTRLNLGMHVGDDPILVQRNRELLQQQTQMPTAHPLVKPTHSTVVVLEVAQPTMMFLMPMV